MNKKILFFATLSLQLLWAEVIWDDQAKVAIDEDLELIYHDYINVAYPKRVQEWLVYEETLLRKPDNRDRYIRPALIKIPKGSFLMGDNSSLSQDDEKFVHEVKIDYEFYLGKYEVTVIEFAKFVQQTGYKSDAEKSGGCKTYKNGQQQLNPYAFWKYPYFKQSKYHPAGCISYNDAQAYVAWLTKQTGTRYRLPTEAEWEYVARAGNIREKSESDLGRYAWYRNNANFSSHLVGRKQPNEWGIYDMQGNVFEWCEDWYTPSYEHVPSDGRANKAGLSDRFVSRGGSWLNSAAVLRVANRAALGESNPYVTNGFRVVRDLK